MAAIVLVHGGFCGGWIWRRVAERLRAIGHEVFTPTLTGLGERVHLADPAIDLETHAEDVLNLLRFEDLRDVLLVGHSYGGVIVTLVADRIAERLGRCLYVDALLLDHGESVLDPDHGIPEAPALHRRNAAAHGGFLPVPGSTSGAAADPISIRLTPQPIATFEQRLALAGRGVSLPAHYIRCRARPASDDPIARFTAASFVASHERAVARGWECLDDPCGHFDILTDGAERLAGIVAARA